MSKESYIRGFSKVANARGYDENQLALFALSNKLKKQAFFGFIPKVTRGISTAGQLASKTAPYLTRGLKTIRPVAEKGISSIGKGVKSIGREAMVNLKNPDVQLAAGATGIALGVTDFLRNKSTILKRVGEAMKPRVTGTQSLPHSSTNSLLSATEISR